MVPAGIGVDPAHREATDLFTESTTGIVWFTKNRILTLGQLFLEWGQPIDTNQIGPMHSLQGRSITWFLNGVPVGDPATIALKDHDEIEAFEDLDG